MEEVSKQNLFEWIRDVKDYDIRTSLQQKIKEMQREIKTRDQEILELQIKLDD